MLWFIQVSVASLIIIYVMHNLYSFFKDTLTVPKIKDMVKRPQQRYDALFRELRNQVQASNASNANEANASNANANANPGSEADNMKNELKRYLMDLNSSQSAHANQAHTNQAHTNQAHTNQAHPNQAHTNQAHANQDPQPQSDFIEMGSIYK
jgi:hypothetical protein